MKFLSKNKKQYHKKYRINPHIFWGYVVVGFLLIFIAQILLSVYVFSTITTFLDTPVLPKLQTNTSEVKRIEQLILQAEKAVQSRTEQKDVDVREEVR